MKYATKYNNKQVDTSNIKIGQVFKTYKVMCEAIGEEPTNTHSRIVQMENWKRYFDFIRYGQKFEIVEIYDEPLDLQLEALRNSLYTSNGAYLIMCYLEQQVPNDGKQFIRLTRTQLLQILNLVDSIYIENNRNRKGFQNQLNQLDMAFTEEQINTAFNYCDDKGYAIVNSVLKAMRQYSMIEWDKVYMIAKNADGEYQEEYTETFINPKTGKKEQNLVDRIKINIAWQYAVDTLIANGRLSTPEHKEIIRKRLYNEIYRIMNKFLFQEYGWHGCFKMYKITPCYGSLWDKIKAMYKEEISYYKDRIRENFYNKLKEKCGEIDNKVDAIMIETLIDFLLSNPSMSIKELQMHYNKTIEKISDYKQAKNESEKEQIMQSFDDMFGTTSDFNPYDSDEREEQLMRKVLHTQNMHEVY